MIIKIYRPPKPNSDFVQKLSELLLHFIGKYNKIPVVGDFKIHVCWPSQSLVTDFMHALECFILTQAVKEPAHTKGHTFDLVLSSGFCSDSLAVKDICVSDHKAVLISVVLSHLSFN